LKIKVYKKDFRSYEEKAIETYNTKGMKGLQEFCVCSQLNLTAIYSILLETIEDKEMKTKLDNLIIFYNYEVVE